MIKRNKLKLFLIGIIFVCFTLFSKTQVNASSSLSSNELLKFNNYTIKKDTTIEQINENFGKPRIEYDSPFGGKACTYYDDEYMWMLHIETNASGEIKGYGCINGDFIARNYSQGDNYSSVVWYMSGTVIDDDDDGKVVGVYEYNVTSKDVELYKANYISSSDYLYNLQKSSLVVSKILAKKHNYDFPQTYIDEDIFYMNEELKDNGTDLYNFARSTGKTIYISLVLSRIDFCDYELPNPLMLGKQTENYTRAENYKYVFYDMKVQDKDSFRLYTTILFVDPAFLEQKETVPLTSNEISLLDAVSAKYQEFTQHGQSITKNFDIEPQYKELPLVAGKWSDMALLMVTDYINLARLGLGLHELKLNQDITDAAQHKAALVVYNKSHGYTGGHFPEQPEGVDDDFFSKAQSYMTENLYTGDIQTSIVSALNDGYGDPIECGHRYNLLDPSATQWGVGAVESGGLSLGWQGVHKVSGFESYTNELVAWPSNGIFTMDLAYNGIGNWTARFYKNYSVSSNTEVTIKCLNTGKTYEITQENKNNSGKFLQVTGSNLITFRDDTIAYENGDVFEITLHNVIDRAKGNSTDYTYRSVFMNMSQINEVGVSDIKLSKESIELLPGESIKIDTTVAPDNATNKLLRYTSSDEDIVTVRQDGTIYARSAGKAIITVTSYSTTGLSKTISIVVNGDTQEEPETPGEYIKGDLDRNSVVNSDDAAIALDLYRYGNVSAEDLLIGDMDENGLINSDDAALILDVYRYGK